MNKNLQNPKTCRTLQIIAFGQKKSQSKSYISNQPCKREEGDSLDLDAGITPRKAAISVTDEAYAPELRGTRALAFPRKFIQKKEQNRQAKACTGWFAEHCVGANSFARRH